jgi:hypothetical protein
MEKVKLKLIKQVPPCFSCSRIDIFFVSVTCFLDVCRFLKLHITVTPWTITNLAFSFYILSMARQTILPSIFQCISRGNVTNVRLEQMNRVVSLQLIL